MTNTIHSHHCESFDGHLVVHYDPDCLATSRTDRPTFQYVEGSNGRDGTYTILDVAGYSHGEAWHELTTAHGMSGRCADLLLASVRRDGISR